MADLKISQLPAATTPLDGTEELPVVQGGVTDKVTVANLTAGRAIASSSITVAAGAVGTPSVTTSGDTNTGVFFPAADQVALAAGGVQGIRAEAAVVTALLPVALADGTVSAPSLANTGDLNTGLYFPADNTVALTADGTQALKAESTAVTAAVPVVLPAGTNSAPSLAATGDLNTGLYFPAADTVALTAGGTQAIKAEAGAVTAAVPVVLPAGTVSAPALSTNGDLDTGVFFPSSNTLAVATNGTERLRVDSSGNVGIGTATPADKVEIQAGTLASTQNALSVTGTLSSTAATQTGVSFDITGAGSGANAVLGTEFNLKSGYTGSESSFAVYAANTSAGTNTYGFQSSSWGVGAGGNFALLAETLSATTGHNFGLKGMASSSSTLNIGTTGWALVNTNSAQRNVGVLGTGRGASSVNVGVWATLYGVNTGSTAFSALTSAAVLADNADSTDPIFIGRDNGSTVFTIDNGSGVNSFGSSEVVLNDAGANIDFRVESDTKTNMLLVDASADRIGINQSAPATTFDLAGAYSANVTAMGALDVDCSAGNYFTKTINGNSTFTVSNVPASRCYSFTLELTHTSGTITWFSGVEWPGGTAPTLTTGKTHLFMFLTDDGGTRWRASALTNYTT